MLCYSRVIHSFPTKWCLTHYLSRLQLCQNGVGCGAWQDRDGEPGDWGDCGSAAAPRSTALEPAQQGPAEKASLGIGDLRLETRVKHRNAKISTWCRRQNSEIKDPVRADFPEAKSVYPIATHTHEILIYTIHVEIVLSNQTLQLPELQRPCGQH